jgi:hypothetical protein
VVEAGAGPDTAPSIFHQEILELGIERSSVLRGARGMRLPKNGFADLFPALVAFFVRFFLRSAPNSTSLGSLWNKSITYGSSAVAGWSCSPVLLSGGENRLGVALVLASSV